MKSIPKRRSTTRLDRRPNGLTIYYKRANDDVEEEMMRISVVTEGTRIDDSLRSSKSSPPSSASTTSSAFPSSSASQKVNSSASGKSNKKKKKKKKSSTSQRKKRTTSRALHVSEKWRNFHRSDPCDEYLDDKALEILDGLKTLNYKIRKRFQIANTCPHVWAKLKSKGGSSRFSFISDAISSSDSFSTSEKSTPKTAKAISNSVSPVLTAEAFDYRGVPLRNPLAIVQFPGAKSIKIRETAREMVNELAKKEKAKEDADKLAAASATSTIKPPVPPAVSSSTTSSKSKKSKTSQTDDSFCDTPPVKLTRVSSDTRFPGARSPATRERVRLLLKQCALKKRLIESESMNSESIESTDSNIKEKNSKENSNKSKSTSSSLKTIYSRSVNVIGCDSCSSCIQCISSCVEKHTLKHASLKGKKQEKSGIEKSQKSRRKKKKTKKRTKKSEKSATLDKSSTSESIEMSEKSRNKKKKKEKKKPMLPKGF